MKTAAENAKKIAESFNSRSERSDLHPSLREARATVWSKKDDYAIVSVKSSYGARSEREIGKIVIRGEELSYSGAGGSLKKEIEEAGY